MLAALACTGGVNKINWGGRECSLRSLAPERGLIQLIGKPLRFTRGVTKNYVFASLHPRGENKLFLLSMPCCRPAHFTLNIRNLHWSIEWFDSTELNGGL